MSSVAVYYIVYFFTGECVLSLKGMFDTTEPQDFECTLTNHIRRIEKLFVNARYKCTFLIIITKRRNEQRSWILYCIILWRRMCVVNEGFFFTSEP